MASYFVIFLVLAVSIVSDCREIDNGEKVLVEDIIVFTGVDKGVGNVICINVSLITVLPVSIGTTWVFRICVPAVWSTVTSENFLVLGSLCKNIVKGHNDLVV